MKNQLFQATETFFNLPEKVKSHYEIPEIAGQRGYVGRYKETAKGHKIADMKEFYHIGKVADDSQQHHYHANIWPKEVPEFQNIGIKMYQRFEAIGADLLRAIALYLNLDETYFNDKIKHGNSILRLLHYFAVEDTNEIPTGSLRAAAHEDINLITLLMGASAEGLQAKTKLGAWIDVNPKPDQIVVNIGDMLQWLTNGKLVSTSHRVVNPSHELMKKPRYSTPFFLHPVASMDLSPLPQTISSDHPKQFENTTAGAYLDQRLRELGLK